MTSTRGRHPARPNPIGSARDLPEDANASATDRGARARRVGIFHQSAGAVVMIDGRCLALRRGDEWVFPKGHLEADERPEDAAVREVREETGLDVRIVRPIGTTRYDFDGPGNGAHRKRVHWFLAERVGGAIRPQPPFTEVILLDRDGLGMVLTYDADREVAERAFEATGADGRTWTGRMQDR